MPFKESLKRLLKQYGILPSPKEEEMVSYEVVYEPDTKDEHSQWMSKEEIEKACADFNHHLKEGVAKSNLFHVSDTNLFTIEDTWVHKELDVTVDGSGQPIKAGTWIAKLKYHDKDLWELKKAGVIGGVSLGGYGVVNKDTGEITNLTFGEKDA